ncbi:MAG TPA: ABC transporter permease [Gaiellaceae bacterium]|nr:ABC transporter permease [Gaiellaceae bacterium]
MHARAATLELARHPAYVVPTLVFPAVFFLFFVTPGAGGASTVKMATFAGFAAIGVAFFQFGVGIAIERASPWERYLRTLPVGVGARLTARVFSAAIFATAAAAVLIVTAIATTNASLPLGRWLELACVLVIATAPFALLGIALGYWAPERGALPIANLLYLGLSYAGGLWIRPEDLPTGVAAVSPYLPTRALADVLSATVTGDPWLPHSWAVLSIFAAIFAAIAVSGYRRDEGRHFR